MARRAVVAPKHPKVANMPIYQRLFHLLPLPSVLLRHIMLPAYRKRLTHLERSLSLAATLHCCVFASPSTLALDCSFLSLLLLPRLVGCPSLQCCRDGCVSDAGDESTLANGTMR